MRLEKQIPCEDDRKKSKSKGLLVGLLVFPTHAQSARMNGPPGRWWRFGGKQILRVAQDDNSIGVWRPHLKMVMMVRCSIHADVFVPEVGAGGDEVVHHGFAFGGVEVVDFDAEGAEFFAAAGEGA